MTMAIDIAATGMVAQQDYLDTIAHDMANANTTAFKRHRVDFHDLIYIEQRRMGTQSSDSGSVLPSGVHKGTGVSTGAVYMVNEQGTFEDTGNELDLAVQGHGYFIIDLPDGDVGYTRAGSFSRNGQGEMVTQEGYKLAANITIPENATKVTINENGEVLATFSDQIEPTSLGTIELAIFLNSAGLKPLGKNLFKETIASGEAFIDRPGSTNFGTLIQRKLENSNVNTITHVVNMMKAQRVYETNSKIMQAASEMKKQLNNVS